MCQSAIRLISSALKEVENAEMVLKIKGVIALFIQTMDVCNPSVPWHTSLIRHQFWGYPIASLDDFLLKLFERYAELLKIRFSDDFQEVVLTICILL